MDKITELLTEAVSILIIIGAEILPPTECYFIYEDEPMQISELLDDIIRREGGLVNHPEDPGGLTNFGITQGTWDEYRKRKFDLPESVADITEDQAREFYRIVHVEPIAKWLSDEHLVALVVDSAINHGPTRVARWMQLAAQVEPDGKVGPMTQRAVNANPDLVYREMLRARLRFYASIVSRDPDKSVFIKGWVNRACEFVR